MGQVAAEKAATFNFKIVGPNCEWLVPGAIVPYVLIDDMALIWSEELLNNS